MTNKTGFKETGIGLIPEDWKVKRIGELVKINESNIGKSFEYDTIEYIDIASVDKGRITELNEIELVNAPSRAKRIVKDNDILISTVRPNLRHYTFIEKSKPNTIASTGFAVISGKKINPRFLYYYLTTNYYTDYLTSIADSHTSAYPSFNPDVIENSFIPYPSESEQESIANILFSLDKKIELNQKMNQTLEKIGQAIFKHWFIDFEFPDEEGKPYKSSGGEMVDSELGEIPKGWEVKDLKDYVKFERGIEPGSKNYFKYQQESMIPFLRVGDLSGKRVSNIFIEEESSKGKICKEEDILLSLDGTVGIVAVGYRGSYSTGIRKIVITDKSIINKSFVWCFLKTGYIQDLIKEHSASKTTIAHAGKAIDFMRMILSDKKTMTNFDNLVSPLFAQIISNIKECQNLSKIRDSLLPKLMSGKIRLNKPINSNHELSKELEA